MSSLWLTAALLLAVPQGAEIKDASGTVARVDSINYCYEEQEGSEVYINKFDHFFVCKGEAVIRVDFDSVRSIAFEGELKDGGRKAVIRMRSGKVYEEEVLCHEHGFLLAEMELGEYRLDMASVGEVVFLEGEDAASFEGRFEAAETALEVRLLPDGTLGHDGELKRLIRERNQTVLLKAAGKLDYSVLVGQLRALHQAGARVLLFVP